MPSLKIGVTPAIFQTDRKHFVLIDMLKMYVNGPMIVSPASFSNRAVTPSSPHAFDGDSFAIISWTSVGSICLKLNIAI